jgi:hypothetical protein
MRKEFKLLIVCIVAVCFLAVGLNALAAEPQQSKTTSKPPLAITHTRARDRDENGVKLMALPTSPVIIPGTPDYLWRHGCGPTAVGNVIGYYDCHGYYDLIVGDANVQTNDVNQAMASGGDAGNPNPAGSEKHYEDYSRPEDAFPVPLTDDYLVNPPPTGRPAHANNCIGDYQRTSQSTHPSGHNYYGWSWSNDLGPSFVSYVNQQNATYNPSYTEYSPVTGKALTWAVLTNEINNNRPMVFLVDTCGVDSTDHFVAVVGYDAPTNQYGCRDSWLPAGDIRWETFQGMGTGKRWGIWGGWSFQLGTQQSEVTKWEQPPNRTPYGMDIRCDRKGTQRVLADDFPCTTTGSITKVRLWGSWKGDVKGTIKKIHLSIHSDDPKGPGGTDPVNTYSKPDLLLWSSDFNSTHFTETLDSNLAPLYEYWWDPPSTPIQNGDHRIWQYEISIDSNQFVQEGNSIHPKIYWLDAYADINPTPSNAYFGWKTSEMHWNDDAVRSTNNGTSWIEMRYPPGHPYHSYPPDQNSIDLAFAIITCQTEPTEEPKWCQGPDLSENGLDVMASDPLILADDFECNKTTKITDITVWGSWKDDYLPQGEPNKVSFTLSIHSDIPASHSPSGYSMPNEVLWYKNLMPSEVSIEREGINEGWYNPYYYYYYFPGDHVCWKYVFHIPEANAFCQQGTLTSPIVYWLDVKAYPWDSDANFGWKSSINHWNDDAVWTYGSEPYKGWWNELRYPSGHPLYYQSIDLAFAIDGNKPCIQAEDFGDAPDPLYPTLLINNGARHIIDGVTFMGILVDAEGNGQPTANADGDDLNPPALDDEDGVAIPLLIRGQAVIVTVTASVAGALDAWIDYSADGSWAAGDQIAAALPLVAGANPITFVVPATATLGQTYARFRFSTAGGLQPFGPASNGEVEDYAVFIEEPPPENELGDAPDSTNNSGLAMTAYPAAGTVANYPTVYFTGSPPFGPIHLQPQAVAYLGQNVTLENEADIGPDQDGINNINPATNTPDQDLADDGVLNMPISLPKCSSQTIFNYQINVVNPNIDLYVNVWFDWNRDGDWDDTLSCGGGMNAPEWAVQNQSFPAGFLPVGLNTVTSLPFVPWHSTLTKQKIWMRITLSEQPWVSTGSGGSGPAAGYYFGETEDYFFAPDPNCLYVGKVFNKTLCTPPLVGNITVTQVMVNKWNWLGRPQCWCCNPQKCGNGIYVPPATLNKVDGSDLAKLKKSYSLNYMAAGYIACVDFNLSGTVDGSDLAVLKKHYTQTVGSAGCQ